jgi:hypothetical protein
MDRYRKAVVAAVGALAAALPLFGITVLDDVMLQNSIVAIVTTALVYLIPNATAA